jgi:hypothetical protein
MGCALVGGVMNDRSSDSSEHRPERSEPQQKTSALLRHSQCSYCISLQQWANTAHKYGHDQGDSIIFE